MVKRNSDYYRTLNARRKLSREPRSVRLFYRDDERVQKLAGHFGEDLSEMIRNLVHEALNARDRRAAERQRAIETGEDSTPLVTVPNGSGNDTIAGLETIVAELRAIRWIATFGLQTGLQTTSLFERLPELVTGEKDLRHSIWEDVLARARVQSREIATESRSRAARGELE